MLNGPKPLKLTGQCGHFLNSTRDLGLAQPSMQPSSYVMITLFMVVFGFGYMESVDSQERCCHITV